MGSVPSRNKVYLLVFCVCLCMLGIKRKQEPAGPRLSPENAAALYFESPGKMTAHSLHAVTAASGIFILKSCFSSPPRLPSPSHCAQANKKFQFERGALRASAALAVRQSASERHIVPPFSFPLSSWPLRKQLSLFFCSLHSSCIKNT